MTAVRAHPPFDPELAVILDALPPEMQRPLVVEDLPEWRENIVLALSATEDQLTRGGAVHVSERQIPGPEGAPDLTIAIMRPSAGEGPWPGIYHTHSGGMVMGDRRTGLAEIAEWVERLGVVAVSVEYRLAPEHPYPAPVDDCYAGLTWTAAHAAELGIDPERLIVAGASAGGGLAAALALMARDRGGPPISHQILMCAMLDDRGITASSHELDGEGVWDAPTNLFAWTALLGDARGGPGVSPYAAPARAEDLTGLPPAFVDVGSVETFRDEDIDYAARLSAAGVSVELHVWPGGFHCFDMAAPDTALGRAAREARLSYLRRALG